MRTIVAIEHFGTVANLAKELGITDKAVYQWGLDVPELRAYQLERLTDGKLKAVPDEPPQDEA